MMGKQNLSTKVYTLAKKMAILQEQEQEDSHKFAKLGDKLNDLLVKCFEDNLDHEIETAIQMAMAEQDISVINTLLNEINIEIETLSYSDSNDNDCDSIMLLLPCIVNGRDMSKPFYSVEELQNKIANKLLEKEIIKQKENFKLSSDMSSFEDTKKMTLTNWWNLHRSIIVEDETNVTNGLQRKKKHFFNSPSNIQGIMLKFIFMQPATENEEDKEVSITNFLSDELSDVWAEIANELTLENEYYNITLLLPNLLEQTTETAYGVFEEIEFNLFFNKYMANDEVSIVYARSQDNPKDYVVMFVQDDSKLMVNFYVYETYGEPVSFVESLVDKAISAGRDNIYYLEDLITAEQLHKWAATQWDVDLYDLMKTAQEIDVNLTKKVFEPYYVNELNPVLH